MFNASVFIICDKDMINLLINLSPTKYRKLPLISPGLIQLCKGFSGGLINGGTYIQKGLYKQNRKNVS